MTGLITSVPPRAASASIAPDHSPHTSSSVKTSSSTLLSTSVVGNLPSRELHDFIGLCNAAVSGRGDGRRPRQLVEDTGAAQFRDPDDLSHVGSVVVSHVQQDPRKR